MNRYFLSSILSFGLMLFLYVFTSFFIQAAKIFDGVEGGGHPLQATLKGLPIWMYMMILLTLGIFFLIFGFKQRLSIKSVR